MRHRCLFLSLGVVASAWAASGCNPTKALASEERQSAQSEAREIQLLVYSSDFGMVQETRNVSLEQGVNRVGLTGVSKSLDQNSVMFSWLDRKDAKVRSSTYDLGMDDSGSLLKRFLGQEVELVYRNQNGTEGDRVKGTLEVADSGNVVVKASGKYIVNPDATIEAPADAGIVTIPQLTAEVESGTAGSTKLGVSYLTGGLSWSADYTLTLSAGSSAEVGRSVGTNHPTATIKQSTNASLDCWASVVNRTGTDFPDATLKFVAGSPNRAMVATMNTGRFGFNLIESDTIDTPKLSYRRKSERTDTSLSSLNVGELHAYPYESKATIRQDQINRVRMMDIQGVTLKKWYAISVPTLWRDGFQGNPDQRLTATLGINFKNDEASKLGKPMPGGAVRVYESDASGRPQYIGAATIQDTPKDARVSLTLSNVFDVYAMARVIKSEKVGRRKVRKTLEIKVHNEKALAQEVRLVQYFYGPYAIVNETAKSAKLNAQQRQWNLSVPSGGEVKLTVVAEF